MVDPAITECVVRCRLVVRLATSAAGTTFGRFGVRILTIIGHGRRKASKLITPGRKVSLLSPAASNASASGVAVGGESALVVCAARGL